MLPYSYELFSFLAPHPKSSRDRHRGYDAKFTSLFVVAFLIPLLVLGCTAGETASTSLPPSGYNMVWVYEPPYTGEFRAQDLEIAATIQLTHSDELHLPVLRRIHEGRASGICLPCGDRRSASGSLRPLASEPRDRPDPGDLKGHSQLSMGRPVLETATGSYAGAEECNSSASAPRTLNLQPRAYGSWISGPWRSPSMESG